MRSPILSILFAVTSLLSLGLTPALGDTVVKNGAFTNVYVYRHPSTQTWEQNLATLKANAFLELGGIDVQKFSRKSIDAFTQALMDPAFPSYFGALHQYGGINPPRFFGSYAASQHCVDAALKDLNGLSHDSDVTQNDGVMQLQTIRSLANCHEQGMDPSTQVNLIFSPDIRVGQSNPNKFASDLCGPGSTESAYHSGGLNTPNFAVLPTAPGCVSNFDDFTFNLSHEDVEILADPALTGHGGISLNPGEQEAGDLCGPGSSTTWKGYKVQRYRSDNDGDSCWPQDVWNDSPVLTWVLAEGTPVVRFSGENHRFPMNVPSVRDLTDAEVTGAQLWIQTGGDGLRGGKDEQGRVDAALLLTGGSAITVNINRTHGWDGGQTHFGVLQLPNPPPRVSDLTGVELITHFTGGLTSDNWDVNKVALRIGYTKGSTVSHPAVPQVETLLDASGGPLVRFTDTVHELEQAVTVPLADRGRRVLAISVIISTGNDDLRGNSNASSGDNCEVTVFVNGSPMTVKNANAGQPFKDWTDHTILIPIPPGGVAAGSISRVSVRTRFAPKGDKWNLQRLRLQATFAPNSPNTGHP